jgi:hypothetical protein
MDLSGEVEMLSNVISENCTSSNTLKIYNQ